MALMAAHGDLTPMPDAAIFADTQGEPESVYKWLDWLKEHLPFPIYRVTRGNLAADACSVRQSELGDAYVRHGIPVFMQGDWSGAGLNNRHCTKDFKLDVIGKKIRELLGLQKIKDFQRSRKMKFTGSREEALVSQWIGISVDEAYRAKLSKKAYIKNRFPLLERGMKRYHCLLWMSEKGYPLPPRSACVFCPYHSNAEWRRLRDEEPEAFARAIQFERDYQHAMSQVPRIKGVPFLHRSLVPLAEADITDDTEQGSLWGHECEGMCGL